MATPDDRHAQRAHVRDQPGRLRVVQHDDVVGPQQRRELIPVGRQRCLVEGALLGPERSAVARYAVQPVVDALADREERSVSTDHQPTSVDTRPAGIGEQRDQHLRHPAAARRRVDVPDPATGELTDREPLGAVHTLHRDRGQDGVEAGQRGRPDGDHVEHQRRPIAAWAAATRAIGRRYGEQDT